MPARLVQPTEAIEVKQLCVLVYGQPGARKSSLAQTAERPFTFATDPGIYRAFGRKPCALFESWADVSDLCADADAVRMGQQPRMNGLQGDDADRYLLCCRQLVDAQTVVIDTFGMAMSLLAEALIAESVKNGNRLGGLSLPGYGALANRVQQWVAGMKARGQDVVFICHEDSERAGDENYYHPQIVGKSYSTLMNVCDVVGYMHFENGQRVLSFNPTDRWMAKTPPCGWGSIVLPDFAKGQTFLAKLIAEAKASMGRVSADSAAVAQAVEQWRTHIAGLDTADAFTEAVTSHTIDLKATGPAAIAAVKKMLWEAALSRGLTWDKKAKRFVEPAEQPQEAGAA